MLYKYVAYTSSGKIVKNKIEFENQNKVKEYLSEHNLIPVEIIETVDLKSSVSISSFSQKQKILIYFFSQLLFYIKSGFTIDKALSQIQLNYNNRNFNIVINNILDNLKKGRSFSESIALSNEKKYFNEFIINIIKSGELSGTLSTSLNTIVEYLKKNHKILNKISTAMIYPVFVIAVSLIVLTVLMIFVIPAVTKLFEKSKIELPIITKIVIFISEMILKYNYILLIIIALLIFIFFKYIKSSNWFYKFSSYVKLNFPVYKNVYINSIIFRFGNAVSVMLENGVDVISALKIGKNIIGNYYYDTTLNEIITRIKEGEKIHLNFRKFNLFNHLFNSSVETGENSGQLSKVLKESSIFFEEELNEQLDRFVAFIEPLLILILGLIVGVIIFSVMIPIFKISTVIKA